MTRKEKIYKYICHEGYKPLTKQELCITLDVPKSDYGAFYAIIGSYWRGQAQQQNKKGRIRKAAAQKAVYGTLAPYEKRQRVCRGRSRRTKILTRSDYRRATYLLTGKTSALRSTATPLQ